ncbi:MAG: DUF2075 domain-containing protein [Ignavibacteriaceae bacterium]|nr:DUF2075 domain-containing protein [Ignavibacteriaceae bacterium]
MNRAFYSSTIFEFLNLSNEEIIGILALSNQFSLEQTQRDAWVAEIEILKKVLENYRNDGAIYLEFSIPRMGQRIDAVLLIGAVIFVLEFKVREKEFTSYAIDQVMDYALDLKNFHETSHEQFIAPLLIATTAKASYTTIELTPHNDKILYPIRCNTDLLSDVIKDVLNFCDGEKIEKAIWESGHYKPTPTIIEAARALYFGHSVSEISRNDASAINISRTSEEICKIIDSSRHNKRKSICFVTGVPGAGKTLVGLNIANKYSDEKDELYSVFLSGNGPLVKILREALTRDKVKRDKEAGLKTKKGVVFGAVKSKIQNVHNFRDECLVDLEKPPVEHVALFDEAQRAWTLEQTSSFMKRKKSKPNFNHSEPEFLISCLDRHSDWAVVVCLVGGGQEINTGEAGISEWINSVHNTFNDWDVYISSRLTDSEYAAGEALKILEGRNSVNYNDALHLAVSMRSFRAENVSLLIKQILDLNAEDAKSTLNKVNSKYPIVITRDLNKAKQWIKAQARGSERYGIVVSSQAERLRPHSIFVSSPMDPVHWFLDDKDDVRSSYYLEDVATEFDVQGLELDWVCVTWDADFRYTKKEWQHWSFKGNKWQKIKKPERQNYLKNAYRVLLTRARQGMVIVIPEGNDDDPTRPPKFYDPTFNYLIEIGFKEI